MSASQHRTIVVGLVWNQARKLLLCRMSPKRGVFPGQWGLPGGGIEPGEQMNAALKRELREELGVDIEDSRPAFFKDALLPKLRPDGSTINVYMIFLIFHCYVRDSEICLNEEFTEYRWLDENEVWDLELNAETKDTLRRIGPWELLENSFPIAPVVELQEASL